MGTEDKPFPGAEPAKLNTFRKYYAAHMGTPYDYRLENYRAGSQDLAEMEKRFGPMYGEWAFDGDISKMPMSHFPYTKLGYTPSFWEDPYRVARYYNAVKAQPPGTKPPDWIDTKALEAAYKYFQQVNGNKPFYDWKYLNVNDPARQFFQSLPMPPDESLLPDEVYYKPTPQAQRQPTPVEQLADPRQNPNWDKLPWWNKALSSIFYSGSPLTKALGSGTMMGILGGIGGGLVGLAGGPAGAVAGAALGFKSGFALGGGFSLLETGLGEAAKMTQEQGWEEASKTVSLFHKGTKFIMDALNLAWEGVVKRPVGMSLMAYGHITEPERYGPINDLFADLPNAWRAASFTAISAPVEIMNLPQGIEDLINGRSSDTPYAQPGWEQITPIPQTIQGFMGKEPHNPLTGATVWQLGQPEPQPLMDVQGVHPEDVLTGAGWIDALMWSRRQIAEGAPSELVLATMMQRYGISGQMRELFGAVVLDPGIHVFPKAATKGLGILGDITGNQALTKAADYVLSMGREGFAGKGKGPITTLRMYETVLKAETPVEVISAGGRFTRWLGGVERTGEIQRAPQIDEATRVLGLSEDQVGQVGKLAEDLNIKLDETNPARGLIERWWEGPEQRAKIRDAMPEVAAKLDEIYPKGIKEGTRWAEGRVSGLEQQNRLLAKIFELTPRSKAVEVLGITADTMKILMDQYEDPADVVAAISRIASMTGLNAEDLSVRFIGTPEGAYLVHALKDFDYKQVQGLLKLWSDPGIATKRDVLNLIAKVRNERPYDVLRQLENADQRGPFFKSLMDEVNLREQQGDGVAAQILEAAKSGIFTEESLAEMFNLFMTKNIPWHPEQWKAMLFDAWMSHVSKWTIDRLGVRVEPLVTRLADVMKAAQSLLLLDINPNYFVNNCINNIATMIIDGSFRIKSIASAMSWFEQFGVYPYKLRQAFGGPSELGDAHVRREKLAAEEMGFIDLAFKSEGEAARAISDAAKGKGGMRVAEDWLKNIRGKVGLFSKLSRKMEEWSSVQATTKGTQQFWDSQWRAGRGYQRMPPALEQQLGPDLSKMIYGLVNKSLNMKQIEDGLVEGQQLYRSIEYFTDDVAKALGMEPEMVTAAMNESGATEFLRQNLPNAKTPGEVRGVFALLRAHVQKHLDDLIVTENVARVETTAAQVKAGDWMGLVDALKDLDRQFDDWWTQHIFKWNDAMGQASKIEDTGVRNKLIAARMAEADMEGRRITGMQVATIDGIQKGMTDAGVGFPENYSNIFRGQLDGWREFFTGRDLAWRDFWAQVQSGELKFGSKDFKDEYVRISSEMDNAYGRQALETSHFQEEMDDAIVRMIADSDEGLADKVGVYFAELRDHKMLQMAREQNIRRVMTQIRIKGTPTGKQVASILRSVFKGDDEWLKAIEPWLKELGEQKAVDAHEINNRLYREYTENLKIPSISERENIRIDNERVIVEPVIRVATEKVEVDRSRVQELIDEGLSKEDATRAAVGEQALVDKGPEIKAIPEQEAIARTQALEGVNLDAVRQAASEAGINTATADGRPMDNWLVNWINGDNGLGLRKSNAAIRRLEELDPKELPRVVDKLNTMRDHNAELTAIAQERGMTLDALKYLEDGRASTAKLRKIAVQNGMPDLLASVAPKSIMNDWLTAKREGMPYRGPGDRLMTLGDAKSLFREMTKGSIEGEQQLNDILTIWEQLAKSQGMTLEEYVMRRLASDDPGIAQALYQAQGVNHPWVQNCIREFGITNDPREGMWLLRDGRMLDGSGRSQGMNVTGRKMISHDDIFMSEPPGPGQASGDTTAKFMQQTGSIRMSVQDNVVIRGDALFQIGGSISPEQLSAIMRILTGNRLATIEYIGLRNGQISDYFETIYADPRNIEEVSTALAKGDEYYPKSLYQAKSINHPMAQAAIARFGLTDDPLRAGYMNRDGSLLDFGDKLKATILEGDSTDYGRKLEHVEIGNITGEGRPSFEAITEFMHETGGVRWVYNGLYIGIETLSPLSIEQMIAVNKIALGGAAKRVYVEMKDSANGKVIAYHEVSDPDIMKLSEMWGELDSRTSRTMYQRATQPGLYPGIRIAVTTIDHPYTKAAIERFGITEDLRRAGYMLRDGKLLDFGDITKRTRPGPFHLTPRQLDFSEIGQVVGETRLGDSNAEFLADTGNVQVDFRGDSLRLLTYGTLSKEQMKAITGLVLTNNVKRFSIELKSRNVRTGLGENAAAFHLEIEDPNLGKISNLFSMLDETGANILYQQAINELDNAVANRRINTRELANVLQHMTNNEISPFISGEKPSQADLANVDFWIRGRKPDEFIESLQPLVRELMETHRREAEILASPEMNDPLLYSGRRVFQMPYDDGLARQRSSALESLRQMGLDQPRIDEILTKRNLEGLDPQARAVALEAIAVTDQIRLLDRTGQRYTFGDHVSWLRKQYGGDFTVRVERSEAAMPTLGEGTQQVWKVVDEKTGITLATFTDETIAGMAAKVINDGGYVQPGTQAPKGSVTFLEDTRAVMRALENPDVSTAIHETGHILLRQLDRPDGDIALDWYRTEYKGDVDRLDDGMFIGKDAEDFQEKFSRAFERYLTEGITPIEALKAVFERMKRWLLDIYHAIAGSEIDVKMTDELRDLFARQLSGDPELRQQIGEYYGARPKAAPVEEPAAPMDVSIGGQLHRQPLTLERWLWDRKQSVETASKVEDPTQRIEAIQQALNQSDSVKEEGWMPSDALAQDALARAKAELRAIEGIPGLTGNGTSAHGADPSKYYDFVYRVVELDDLIPSHKLNGEDNPDYPSAFQPRQRDRVASRQQIIRIASELDPNSLIYQSQRIDDGAPIIGKDLLVESGNGRVLGLQLATDQYPQNYQAYKNKLLQDATIYGLDPEALRQMDRPILVRQRVSDVDREQFVNLANERSTAAMSVSEMAASDGKLVEDEMLGALYVGETQSIEEVLRSPSNRNFVQTFINKVPKNDQGAMLDESGQISKVGIQRIIGALFSKTFGGEAGRKLTQLALESLDVDVRRVISGIQGALPELARSEALIDAGRRPESLSIGDDIAAAAMKLQVLRSQGMSVDTYIGQMQMFGGELTDFQRVLLLEFGKAQSTKAVREPLRYFGQQVEAQPDTSQTGMFGGHEYPTKEMLWELAKTQGQQQLFQMPPETKMGAMNAVPEPLYMGSLQQEAWDNVQPVLNEMERRMSAGDGWTKTFKRADLDAALGEQRPDFIRWINDLRPDMASTKHTAIRWGENVRDWALLNYQARRGFDGPLSLGLPYVFWPTRTFLRWALRTIDRPGLMANYFRFNQVASMYRTEQFPSRLRGKWRVPLPFLPEWMNGGMWVDPLRQWFPPAMFAENIMRVATEKDRMAKSAAYILEKWVSEGRVSANDAKQATLTMEGDLWGEAVEAAQADEQGEYSGPLDYLGVLSSLALPFDIARQYARGTPESIQPLPLTRLLKGVTAPFGIGGPGGVNIEAPLRKAVDLPVFDRFEEYRVERMVANMVAEGEIDPKDAEQIFLSHQGPGWDEAEKRVNQARFFGTYANPLYWMGMPADSFPKGEAKLRGLTAEWNRAIDSYHKGDSGALRRMMEEYPEYQFRMDLWKNPQERLRWFLVDEIWTKYNELGSANKELVRMQLGEEFQRTFLDKPPEGESRDYEAIQIELLAFWSQALGAQLPPLPERNNGYEMPKLEPVAPEQQVSLLPPEIANEIDTFRSERNSQYPNWFAIQQRYFDEPKGDARKAYLAANPELKRYWDWKSQYYKDHPMVDAYYKRYSLSDEEGQELANWSVAEILSNPVLMRQITAQQLIGEPLSSGALEELKRIWESMGRPGNSFDQFISEVVSSSNQ